MQYLTAPVGVASEELLRALESQQQWNHIVE
jgi:hypothetical protein